MPWGIASVTLLERDTEQAALERLLEAARAGAGGLALVEGPAGIGKSSLLAATIDSAGGCGMRTLAARGSPLEAGLSFGLALGLLAPAIGELTDAERGSLLGGAGAVVETLFEPARAGGSTVPPELDVSLAVLHGLYSVVAELAEAAPLLLAIDDLHWADEASLRLLHYVAQRLAGLPVAIVGALRSGEVTDTEALAELRAHPEAHALRLEPLSPEAVEALVTTALPEAEPEFCAACSTATAGNPFYLRELLRAVQADEVAPTAAGARSLPKLGPKAITRAVLARLGRMPRSHRALARAAAIIADGAPLHHLASVAGLEPAAAAEVRDALAEADILAPGREVRFAHPLVREALYADLPAAERAHGHLEAAYLLHAEHAKPEEVAVHLLAAERGGERWVVDTLCAAAERARERGDPAAASAYLERALDEGGGLARRGEILFQLGLAVATRGDERARALILDGASEIADADQRAFALMNLARILGVRGRYRDSAETFRAASEVLAGQGSELAWWAEAGFAMSGSLDPQTRAEARPLLEEFLDRPDLEVLPIGRSLLAFEALERVYEARPAAEAVVLARRVAAQELGSIEENGVAFRIASAVLSMCGELSEAERVAEVMLAAAREQGSAVEVAAVSYQRMHALLQRGRPGDVIREALTALDGLRLGFGVAVPATHVALSFGHLERGELDEAERALELPGGEERWRGDQLLGFVGEARGALLLARGDAAGALDELLRTGRWLDELGLVNPAVSPIPWRGAAAVAAARVGERERAISLAEEELALAERFGAARAIGAALRNRGLAEGGDDGIPWLERSVGALDGTAYELELARSLTELGAALRRKGSRRESRESLGRAADVARRCGALALAERAHTELRAAGARPRSLVLTGPEALTPSERRVADLAAQGLTNRQIAGQLFLTKKTVETHLGAVYRKLDVGREGLADALAQRPR